MGAVPRATPPDRRAVAEGATKVDTVSSSMEDSGSRAARLLEEAILLAEARGIPRLLGLGLVARTVVLLLVAAAGMA